MEIRQLEAFAAVMTSGSVTAAGRLLGRSQPAITRLIQELESEIGFALFARSGPRVSPTERGFLLYEEVEHALVGLQQIRARAAEIAREENRSLQIAATPALAAGLLPWPWPATSRIMRRPQRPGRQAPQPRQPHPYQ